MNVDEWIDGARRTERSVRLYQRPDLIADLDELDRRIELARAAGEPTEPLVEEWQAVAQRFANSGLLVRVRSLSGAEVQAMQAEALIERLELDAIGLAAIAAACVEPSLTVEQLSRLLDKVGESQVMLLGQAVVAACAEPPEVNSDAR